MRRPRNALMMAVAALLLLADGVAHASGPTTADCLAASDASLTLGNQHKLRDERSQLLTCAAKSCPADVRKECARRVDEVSTQIPTIIFQAKDASGADLGAVKVTMDGERLAERLEGTALAVDPGEHTFTFETAGQAPVTRKLLIQQAQKDRREVVQLGTPPTVAPPVSTAAEPSAPAPAEDAKQGLGGQKTFALVAGGIGVVGLGLGAAFGLVALSQKNAAESACPSSPCSTQAGATRWSSAGSSGNISTIAFIVGGVGVAGAAVLWLTAPSTTTTQVGFGPGSLQLKGAW
jgi:hypothetical protein